MFTIHSDWSKQRVLARRDFLQVGLLGPMALSSVAYKQVRASHNQIAGSFGKASRCILVFLNGGPSHLDLWDMKPEAPVEVRGELASIPTNVPGSRISELLPMTARCLDKLKIVRSVTHDAPVHTTAVYTMLTGVYHATPAVDQTRVSLEDHPH